MTITPTRTLRALLLALVAPLLAGCHDVEQFPDDPEGNFEQLWKILDEHYCFFAYKDVDWDEVHGRYRQQVNPAMTGEELFDVCARMLDELRDGHTNLSAPFNTSYYRKWWSDYPQNYQARVIEEYYFNFNYRQTGGFTYGILPKTSATYITPVSHTEWVTATSTRYWPTWPRPTAWSSTCVTTGAAR